ncbi:MAG: hypothetical protein LC634_00560 [Sphingomonadales bacterium]|nr:hypothetical protein [Sphingomonadales bacterium]
MPTPFTHRFRVRYAEVDPQSVVFNSRYLEYADLVLTEYWRALDLHFSGEDAIEFHVVRAEIDFRSPIRADELVDGRIWTERAAKTRPAYEEPAMASNDDSDLQTRRKRALLVAGAIGIAAIAWNADDWWSDDIVHVETGDREEAREAIEEAREEIREAVRDARGEARAATAATDSEAPSDELPRITEEGGVLRVETPDGRTVTISSGEEGGEAAEPAEESNN